MLKLFRFLKPYAAYIIGLVVSIAVQAWGTLQLPTLMSSIVNDGIMKNDRGFIWGTAVLMIGCALLSAGGALLSSFFSARVGAAFGRDLRRAVFKKIMQFSVAEVDDFSTASLITRTTNDITQIQQVATMIFSMMVRVPIMAIGSIVEAVRLAPDMTWIIALAVVTLVSLIAVIMSIVMPKFEIYQKLLDRLTLLTRENLTGLRVIRAFNNQKYEERKFDKSNTKLMNTDIFISKAMSLQNPLMMLIFNGTSLLCIWIGISNLEFDASYLGKMMAFMQYATQTILSFLFLSVMFVILPRANVSAHRINDILNEKLHIDFPEQTEASEADLARIHEKREGAFAGETTGCLQPSVEFRNVDFAYADAEEEVLHDISFRAEAGKTTAFIGSTGSGKSTLIRLVSRAYDATAGEVLIDGINIKNFAEKDLMRRIGMVPQRAFLFSGTVRSNILFGVDRDEIYEGAEASNKTLKKEREEAMERRMKKAAEISQAKEFIERFPDKYDAPISEAGTNVSGGQKQRLAIARAIAKDPEIYVFDDAFSALDMKTDRKLRMALKTITENAVTLIVAQRVSTIKDADQIVVLDKGKIVGKGTHQKLLKDCKVYQEICKSQLSDAEYENEVKLAKEAK